LDWQVIEALFHKVTQLDETEREQFWETGKHDDSIRDVVESLLEHDLAAPTPADQGVVSLGQQSLSTAQSQASELRLLFNPGAIVNGVELLFPVAQTESSEVWCGQTAKDQQRVAVKFLRASDATAIQAERFAREVEVLKRLKHPNVAAVLGAGNTEFGNPYFVMQWINGVPITEYCDQRQLTIRERVRLVCSLCEAIDYANKFLIVHRDLKPDNVLVHDNGEVAVLDFGIAKIMSSEDSNDLVELTQRHERLLTPAYSAPEQNRGDAISTATDVHGIGLILYELLCGHHAFSDTAQSVEASLFDRVCSGVPNVPSQLVGLATIPLTSRDQDSTARKNPQLLAGYRQATPVKLRRKLRGKLDLITAAALEKDPSVRISSASELRKELLNWMENRPLGLQSSKPTVSAVMHRYPGRFAAICSVLAALIGGSAIYWFSYSRLQDRTAKVEQLEVEVRQQAAKLIAVNKLAVDAEASNEALNETLARVVGSDEGVSNKTSQIAHPDRVPDSLAIRSAQLLVSKRDFEAVDRLVDRFESQPPESLEERIVLADIYRSLGRTTKGIELFGTAIADPVEFFD
jgi:serine/threonine-protein kinase